jgi:hypothetical protein
MTKRTLLLVAALLLLLGGGALYYWTVARPAAAASADCADKPKPKNDFVMAAECDGGEKPPAGQAAPSTPR